MTKSVLIKKLNSKLFLLKIMLKNLFGQNNNAIFLNLDEIEKLLLKKKDVTVVCSGPSANKLTPNKDNLYLTTNDSYKLVENYDFLYYVNDGYFFRRFLANSPYCKNHINNIFYYNKEDDLHSYSFKHFERHIGLLKNNNFLITKFKTNIKHSNANHESFIELLESNKLPVKIQNSGIFLMLFGFYLSIKYGKNLNIYGLDLGVGGNVHFNNEGHVGKSIIRDSVKRNTKIQLDIIYNILSDKVKNYSYFNPKH